MAADDIQVVVVITNPNNGGGGGGSVDLTPVYSRLANLEAKQGEDEVDIPAMLARIAALEAAQGSGGLPTLPNGYARLMIGGNRLTFPNGDYMIARVQ